MANFNKVFLIGRLTRDPDPQPRFTAGGVAVTDLRLATSRRFKDKDGQLQEEKLFIDVAVWGYQAESCCRYLHKGRLIHVEGHLKMDTWEDRTTGKEQSKIKIVAENVQFLDSNRRDDLGGSSGGDDYAPPPRESQARRPAPEPRATADNGPGRSYQPAPAAPSRRPPPAAPPADDEDIPF